MKIDHQNVVNHELIGLCVTVVESANRYSIGMSGRIIDESRNAFTIEIGGREKMAAKHCNTFEFTLPEGSKVRINGDLLLARPEDRAAKNLRC